MNADFLLDWKLATFCFSLQDNQKLIMGLQKNFKRCNKRFLPKNVINRVAKKGFNPANDLFNTTLKDFIFDTIQSKSLKL